MEQLILKSFILLTFYFLSVSSQQLNQEGNNAEVLSGGSQFSSTKNELNILKNPDSGHESHHVTGLFNGYRPGSTSGVGISTSNGNTQGYTYTGYTQEANPYGGKYSSPIFDVSSTGDFTIAAYFSPLFWGAVVAVIAIALVIFVVRLFGGFEKLGGYVKDIGEKTASGKSLDVDRLTTLVYRAIDKFGNLSPKSS